MSEFATLTASPIDFSDPARGHYIAQRIPGGPHIVLDAGLIELGAEESAEVFARLERLGFKMYNQDPPPPTQTTAEPWVVDASISPEYPWIGDPIADEKEIGEWRPHSLRALGLDPIAEGEE